MKKVFPQWTNTVIVVCAVIALVACCFLVAAQFQDGPSTPDENEIQDEASSLPFRKEVRAAYQKYGIEEARIYAVILTESSFRPEVISPSGAVGLMQMLPSTYEELCLSRGTEFDPQDLKKPEINIDFCCEYLLYLYNLTGNWNVAHLAYHAGIGNVNKWLKDPECSADGKTIDRIPSTASAKYLERINAACNAYRSILKAENANKTV